MFKKAKRVLCTLIPKYTCVYTKEKGAYMRTETHTWCDYAVVVKVAIKDLVV